MKINVILLTVFFPSMALWLNFWCGVLGEGNKHRESLFSSEPKFWITEPQHSSPLQPKIYTIASDSLCLWPWISSWIRVKTFLWKLCPFFSQRNQLNKSLTHGFPGTKGRTTRLFHIPLENVLTIPCNFGTERKGVSGRKWSRIGPPSLPGCWAESRNCLQMGSGATETNILNTSSVLSIRHIIM